MKFTKITNSSKEGTLKPYFDGWLKERFGDCFSQVSVMTTLKLKNAVKDTARFSLGEVPQNIEDLTKRFEMPPQGLGDYKFIMGWSDDEGNHQGSIERDLALQEYVSKYPDQWEIAKKALALPRQRSRHASAFVISSAPVSDFIPITSVSGVKVTAFTGTEIENVGALKMDFLVISCLLDIQACLQLVAQEKRTSLVSQQIDGKKVPAHRLVLDPVSNAIVDIWDLPSDNSVFQDISQSKTETVFQLCTPSALQWLKHFNYNRPDGTPAINSIASIAAFTALDRPGPLNYMVASPDVPGGKHNLLVEYSRRVRGLKGSTDVLPIFDELLPETFGLIVFQESLQKVYQTLTGCTGAEAEEFRRLSAKKLPEKMVKLHDFFVDNAAKKIGTEKAQQVWTGLLEFSAYSFNCSHATAYGVIAYACAWLKHHYPLEWWCSVLKNATKDEIYQKFWMYVKDIVDLPDISKSKPTWSIENGRIRAPIDICYGIGESAHAQLLKYAPYSSADDFCQKIIEHRKSNAVDGKWGRSSITIGTIHTLLVSGIFDSLFDPTHTVAERIEEYQALLKKHTLAAGKKYNKSKTKYTDLDALGRYQAKKDVLPAYVEDIRDLCYENNAFYEYKEWDRILREEVTRTLRIVGLKELQDMNSAQELPSGGFKCAIVAHVDDTGTIAYQNKTKIAKKIFIDSCGFKTSVVYWPNNDELPQHVNSLKKGTIIIGVITKTDLTKGWSFRDLKIVRGPLSNEEEKAEVSSS